MPYSNIDKPSKYFDTKLYTGNGSTQTITGLNFAPEWVWLKDRTSAYNHAVFDKVRGVQKRIFTNLTNAEDTASDTLTAFNSDGFTLGSNVGINTNGDNYVSWNWDANGAGVSNTQGTITSTVSANTTSGFSIVSYTGNGTGGATIGHGLGVAPKMIIIKGRGTTYNWVVGHNSLSTNWGKYLTLSTTDAVETATNVFNDTAPTSSLFSIGTALGVNTSSSTYIAYCFAEVKGFSKFGSYTGNGSADGTFVYTGFKPAWVLWKNTATAGTNWVLMDNRRNTYNPENLSIAPNTSDAEANFSSFPNDFLSNGFKLRNTGAGVNASGSTYIYMAFADNPFVSSKGIPCTAR